MTLPIDTRTCQVELQSGQFFQQGVDFNGNPVFYFRNMCAGMWRADVDASVLAVVHRAEAAVKKCSKSNPYFQCTLVVLMGPSTASSIEYNEGESSSVASNSQATETISSMNAKKNEFYVHTNFKMVQRLIGIVCQNYPERLGKALVVLNGGFGWEKMLGTHALRRYVQSSKTRCKIEVLDDLNGLQKYISQEELVDLAGGHAHTKPFELN